MTPEQQTQLREPFPASAIGKLPKGGTTLDYVGHAAVTDRLLAVDPAWTWEPVAYAPDGSPLITSNGNEAILWIRLTVCGVTRLGCGTASPKAFELPKQLISDAIRNAAMRFGVALDLWAKEDIAPPAPVDTGGFASHDEWVETVRTLGAAVNQAGRVDEVRALGLAYPWRKPDCDRIAALLADGTPADSTPGAFDATAPRSGSDG